MMFVRHASLRLKCPFSSAFTLISVLAAALLGGCGRNQGPERVVVSGTVNHNGKPIADGAILFAPTSALPTVGGVIMAGKYKVDGLGGVPVGTHKVRFEAFRTDPLPGKDPQRMRFGDTVRRQYLPDKFNANSQMEMTIPPGSREITKNFDLTD
jgi:hypothetical protein